MCFPFVGDAVGGSHLSALLLIEGLRDTDYEPLVVVHEQGPLTVELDRRGVDWLPAPGRSPFSARSRTTQAAATGSRIPALASFLRHHGVDVVHTNDARIHRTWGLASRAARRRHVWHQRNAGLSKKMAAVARLADEILAVSSFVQSTLPPYLSHRTRVIDNPFEPSAEGAHRHEHREALVRELGCSPGVPIISFVAQYIPRKRPLVFVDMAAKLLRTHGVEAIFPMFGERVEPTATAVDRRIQELGLECEVRHMGFRAPVDPWLAASDVMVAPSTAEPFSRTVVEAMFLGTPVVASADGGNVEIIRSGTNGMLVPADDEQAFATAVAHVLTGPDDANEMARAAQADVTARFSIARHVATVVEVYDSLH